MYISKKFLGYYFQFLLVVFLIAAAVAVGVYSVPFSQWLASLFGIHDILAFYLVVIPEAIIVSNFIYCFSFRDGELRFEPNAKIWILTLKIIAAVGAVCLLFYAMFVAAQSVFQVLIGLGVDCPLAAILSGAMSIAGVGLLIAIRLGKPKKGGVQ